MTPAQTGGRSPQITLRDVEAQEISATIIENYFASPAPTVIIPHQLQAPPADFTGRATVLAPLVEGGTKHKFGFVISGMGGVGKTSLALKLAEALKARYSDSQLFLDLLGTGPTPLSPWKAMRYVIESYDPHTPLPSDEQKLIGKYRSVLADRKAILFLDNARDEAQVQPLLPPAGPLLIVTSRKYFVLPGFSTTKLDVMLPKEAQALLKAIAPQLEGNTETLARVCGYLPFALRLAATVIANGIDVRPEDRIRQLSARNNRAQLIDECLSLSYALLPTKERMLWQTLAVFCDAFDPSAASAVWDIGLDDAQKLLSHMLGHSMIEWNEQTSRYRLHDLAQLFADNRLEAQERETARRRHAGYYATLTSTAYEIIVSRKPDSVSHGFAMLSSDWMNVVAGQSWAASRVETDKFAARLCVEYATRAAYFHLTRHDPPELLLWLELATRADRYLGDRQAEMKHLHLLASLYELPPIWLGEHHDPSAHLGQAITGHERVAKMAREISDERHEGDALQHLAALYAGQSETGKAIECGERALVIYRKLGNRTEEARCLMTLGDVYQKTDDSVNAYQRAARIYHELRKRLEEANASRELGRVYRKSDDTKRAVREYQRALEIFREIGDRRGEADILVDLGEAYRVLGDCPRSLQCTQPAATALSELGDRPRLADALLQVALCQSLSPPESEPSIRVSLGERGIEPAEQCLAIAREVGKTELVTICLQILATVHSQLGGFDLDSRDWRRAEGHFKGQLVAASELRKLGGSFDDRGTETEALLGLGLTCLYQGQYPKAKTYLAEGLDAARRMKSKKYEAKIFNGIGKIQLSMREANLALDSFNHQLSAAKEIGDKELVADSLWGIGVAYNTQNRAAEAVIPLNEALRIARETGDKGTQANILDSLGSTVFRLGKRDEAIKHAQAALTLLESIDHPQAAERVRRHLASYGSRSR